MDESKQCNIFPKVEQKGDGLSFFSEKLNKAKLGVEPYDEPRHVFSSFLLLSVSTKE